MNIPTLSQDKFDSVILGINQRKIIQSNNQTVVAVI
jgi:hypothetical protein